MLSWEGEVLGKGRSWERGVLVGKGVPAWEGGVLSWKEGHGKGRPGKGASWEGSVLGKGVLLGTGASCLGSGRPVCEGGVLSGKGAFCLGRGTCLGRGGSVWEGGVLSGKGGSVWEGGFFCLGRGPCLGKGGERCEKGLHGNYNYFKCNHYFEDM